jgi:hypothetical protein
MIIATHTVVAAATAQIISQSPIGAFLVGILSHFVLDSWPHWDYPLETLTQGFSVKTISRDFLRLVSDCLVGFFLIFFFFQWQEPFNLILWSAALGGITPDIIHNLTNFWRTKPLTIFSELHNWFHCTEDLKNSFLGLTIQFFIITTFIFIYFSL